MRQSALVAATILLLGAAACGGGGDATSPGGDSLSPHGMVLSAPGLVAGEPMDARFSCDGDNVSPELTWSGVPDDADQLALLVEDPDAPRATPFVHWVVWGIAPDSTGVAEGASPSGATEGRNDAGGTGYTGPCPPGGEDHRYVFTLFALTGDPGVDAGAEPGEARAAVVDAAEAAASVTFTFSH